MITPEQERFIEENITKAFLSNMGARDLMYMVFKHVNKEFKKQRMQSIQDASDKNDEYQEEILKLQSEVSRLRETVKNLNAKIEITKSQGTAELENGLE